jgi:hypothetical protein
MRPYIDIDRIRVTIRVFPIDPYAQEFEPIGYTLEEQGYPPERPIEEMCTDIGQWKGIGLTGRNVSEYYQQQTEPHG